MVKGYTARLYLDGDTEPQLVTADLKRPWVRGQVGLWGRIGGANFANFQFTSDNSEAPAPSPKIAPAAGVIPRWSLSPTWDAVRVSPEQLPAAGADSLARWDIVEAETSGIVNIAQYRRKVAATTANLSSVGRDVVFARSLIRSVQAQRVRLVFGYSDEVSIFLNGRLLFSGDSRFRSRDTGFLGILNLGPDVLHIDLAAGRNELVFAVTESFGGWGMAARVEPAAGITFEAN